MIKKSFFLLIILPLLGSCMAKSVAPSAEKALTTVNDFPGKEQTEIYNRSIEYIARNYNSADAVIQLRDPDNGKIVAKGLNFAVGPALDFGIKRPFRYTLLIDVKPEKMRIRYENVVSVDSLNGVAGPNMNFQWEFVKQAMQSEITRLVAFVNSSGSSDNW